VSLDPSKLEKVVALADGVKRARCPACAEGGHDRSSEHLRIYPDGRFGCCVYPKDPEHRKRIYALAGERSRRVIKVRVAGARSVQPLQGGIFGKLGELFPAPKTRDAWDALNEVETEKADVGTLGTGEMKSAEKPANTLGTLGTPFLNPRAYREENIGYLYKEFETPVPSVPRSLQTATEKFETESSRGVPSVPKRMPHFLADGTLVIPFSAPERFHWWKGGQTIAETRKELLQRGENHDAEY